MTSPRPAEDVPEPRNQRRPNLSGDLPRTFTHSPVFRRAPVGGYDRFQVDAYVQWAEDELASGGRQRAELVAHLAATRAELDEVRRLLGRSPAAAEFLHLSRRIGALLATAADQADAMRADGESEHAAAVARAHRIVDDAVADAERLVAEATEEAGRLVADANAEAERVTAEAGRLLAEAERTERDAREEAGARVAKAQAIEQRAREEADRLRRAAQEDAAAARQQARADVVRLLEAGREQRRRSDEEAAARRASAVRTAEPAGGTAADPAAEVPPPREVTGPAVRPGRTRAARDLLHLGQLGSRMGRRRAG